MPRGATRGLKAGEAAARAWGDGRVPRSVAGNEARGRLSPMRLGRFGPSALLLFVAGVGAAAGLCSGLALVRGRSGEPPTVAPVEQGLWSAAVSGVVDTSPALAPLLAMLLAALVAPRFREAAVVRRTRELGEQVEQRTRELARANAELDRIAHLDPLTQVANRRVFDRQLLELRETNARVGLVLVDVDRFKSINDQFGHAVGDLVLQRLAEALSVAAAGRERVARIGGDEFALLVPLGAEDDPAGVAMRVVAELERTRLDIPGLDVGVSLGWALAEPGDSRASLFLCADAALYRAKRGGIGLWSASGPGIAWTEVGDGDEMPDPLSDTAELAVIAPLDAAPPTPF